MKPAINVLKKKMNANHAYVAINISDSGMKQRRPNLNTQIFLPASKFLKCMHAMTTIFTSYMIHLLCYKTLYVQIIEQYQTTLSDVSRTNLEQNCNFKIQELSKSKEPWEPNCLFVFQVIPLYIYSVMVFKTESTVFGKLCDVSISQICCLFHHTHLKYIDLQYPRPSTSFY